MKQEPRKKYPKSEKQQARAGYLLSPQLGGKPKSDAATSQSNNACHAVGGGHKSIGQSQSMTLGTCGRQRAY